MRAPKIMLAATLAAASLFAGCSRNLADKASRLEARGEYAEALELFHRALDKTPDHDAAKRSEIMARMGDCQAELERYPEAFSSYKKAIDIDPKNSHARLRMGELLLAAGAPETAREQALLAMKYTGDSTDALELLGQAWAAVDKPELAKKAFEQVLETDPRRVKIAVALADIYNQEDDIDKAREILKNAVEAHPQSAMPLLAMARLEEQQGDGAAAELAYRQAVAVEDTPKTNFRLAQFLERSARVTEAEQVLRKMDSRDWHLPVALGDFKLASGHADDAVEQYRFALSTTEHPVAKKRFWSSPPALPAKQDERASVMARLIEAQIQALPADSQKRTKKISDIRGQIDDAREVFDPGAMAVLSAELALADNNLPLAEFFSSSAVELAPESAAAHYIAGCVASANREGDKAEQHWQQALDEDRHFAPARLALAEAALARKDGGQADEQVREVVREDPGNFRALVVFAHALLMESKLSAAAVMAERAAALDPAAIEPMLLMGEVAMRMNRIPEALMNFEHAVLMHPESKEALEGLMRVYRYGNVSYASIRKMELVAVAPPTSSTLLEIVARLYADHGWYKEAIAALKKTVELDPKRMTAVRLLAQLQWSTGDVFEATEAATKVGGKSEPLLQAYKAEQKGNWSDAIANYERALREGDQTGVAANNLAWLLASHGVQLDRALELAGAAAKASPNNPAVLDTVGFVLLKRREYTAAVKALETAAKLSTMKTVRVDTVVAAQIRKHLSDAYYAAGQTEAAFQIAQNRGPFATK